jgi:hypothetical protein
MPRRIFTARDLLPLRAATQRVLEQEPDAALVAAAAKPFKRRIPTAGHVERAEVLLPVAIETSTSPQGVPLHEIAKAVQEEVPAVTGVSVTPGGLSLKFEQAPTAAQRRKLDALLSSKTRLERLKPTPSPLPDAVARPEAVDEELLAALRDPQTSDAAWMRAFRRYATARLIPPSEEPETPAPPDEPEG